MKKVVLYIAMSLDGFIADENQAVDWLAGDGSDPQARGSYERFILNIDTVIMGYTTYHQIVTQLAKDNWPYRELNTYVMTHQKLKDNENIFFTDVKLENLISDLKEKPGKDIWICGGASIVNQLIELDLIDEYYITVIPTILDQGIRLFNKQGKQITLKLIATENYNGMVDLRYQRR